MSVVLENHILKVSVHEKGAELFSVFNKKTKLEYMWSGDPAFWGKTSPVLFPIVGALKKDSYFFNGKSYSLPRHGFARDRVFEVESKTIDQVVFRIESGIETLNKFPFSFSLRIIYQIKDNSLTVSYDVVNEGGQMMHFSLGAHPAFKVPLVDTTRYEDYYLEFNSTENAPAWAISPEGLIANSTTPVLQNTSRLPLRKELFYEDALVFKNLKSDSITLKSALHQHGLDFAFAGFPFFGIWAAKGADFVCLEPWCGIADPIDHNQHLESKEGIQHLEPGNSWSRNWSIKCF
jgi:galactose mutarotase-like enzyme